MIRRINLFAGPCAGKSTQASWLHGLLKKKGYDIEAVQEYVKAWAFIGRNPKSFDQWYIFGKQMHREDIVLRLDEKSGLPGTDFIITDSPITLSVCYGKKYNAPGWKHLQEMSKDFEAQYPSLNIFLNRGPVYKQAGRYQTLEQAIEIDNCIKNTLSEMGIAFYEVSCLDDEGLLNLVLSHLPGVDQPAAQSVVSKILFNKPSWLDNMVNKLCFWKNAA